MDPLLAEALAPVLRDIANTCAVALDVRDRGLAGWA
jgi:hypothetical protein